MRSEHDPEVKVNQVFHLIECDEHDSEVKESPVFHCIESDVQKQTEDIFSSRSRVFEPQLPS